MLSCAQLIQQVINQADFFNPNAVGIYWFQLGSARNKFEKYISPHHFISHYCVFIVALTLSIYSARKSAAARQSAVKIDKILKWWIDRSATTHLSSIRSMVTCRRFFMDKFRFTGFTSAHFSSSFFNLSVYDFESEYILFNCIFSSRTECDWPNSLTASK